MAIAYCLLTVLLAAHPIGAVAALASRGALGRGLVAGCGLAGALAGLGLCLCGITDRKFFRSGREAGVS